MELEIGSIWIRKSDATAVRVIADETHPAVGYAVVTWQRLDGRRKGSLDRGEFAHRYKLAE